MAEPNTDLDSLPTPQPAVDGAAGAAPIGGGFGSFLQVTRPKLRVTSEYDSESPGIFNKVSCRLFDNLAKLKLTFRNDSRGGVSEPHVFLTSKLLSLQYDVAESDALIKASFEIVPGLQVRAAHEVKIKLYNSMVDKDGTDGELEVMKAYKAAHDEYEDGAEVPESHMVSSALIDKVDAMLQNLEKEIDEVDAKIGDQWRILDRDHDGKVTPGEVTAAAAYLKDTLAKEGVQELISNLSKDTDGKILVEDIVRLGSRVEVESRAESEEM